MMQRRVAVALLFGCAFASSIGAYRPAGLDDSIRIDSPMAPPR